MKIAFAAICKGSDKEANELNKLLASVRPFVDGIFVTITQPNDRVVRIAEMYDATVSHFEWVNDFSAARNFNFSQVPKEYDYIFWGDADDEFLGLEDLKRLMEENKADGYVMDYHYDHDKYGMPTVVHPKTQIVSNDGTFTWKGKIHEDLDSNRDIKMMKFETIKRIHRTSADRVQESAKRNLTISQESQTGDPRDLWNLANGYTGTGEYNKAIDTFLQFMQVSESEMERYMAAIRIANMYLTLGDRVQAEEYARKAISIRFDYPDAYHTLSHVLKASGAIKEAINAALEGLNRKPPIDSAIVYNPRDYDYNPLMTLANLYWETAQYERARTCLEACAEIQPKNRALDDMIKETDREHQLQTRVIELVKEMKDMTDEEFTAKFDSLEEEERQFPLMLHAKNQRFTKITSSGKDLVYYCGQTLPWTPDSLKEGIGGSEEAVINLTKEWAKAGYNVTVYNNCPVEKVYDGVTYKPWYLFNYRDKQDIVIIWRHPKMLDYDINATKVFVDMHDVVKPGEFTEKRLHKIDKIFLKSEAHRDLFPNVPRDKVVVIPNAMDTSLFDQKVKRDPYLIINTSSPDRALSAIVRIFPKVKAKEPKATMKWAYGFGVYDEYHKRDKEKQAWKKDILEKMESAGVDNLGKISHKDIAKLTLSAGVMLYPTHFMEIDCVSARKAQLAGAHVVSSDFGALKTTVKYGYKIPSTYTNYTWCPPYCFDFGDDESRDDEYVEAILKGFKNNERDEMMTWARTFTPPNIANQWQAFF